MPPREARMREPRAGPVAAGSHVAARFPSRDSRSGAGRSALVEAARTELLVRLLSRHQEELFRYIFTLLPNEDDAREVLQETSVALFRKFADYDPDKPFLAWAHGFAYLEVLKQRERTQRNTRLL